MKDIDKCEEQTENTDKNFQDTFPPYIFNRVEFAGSLGDLGTLLPLAIGMIVINGLNATNVMVTVGLFYILAGFYFKVPIAVQPMKVIGAYAIASGLTQDQITSASLWMGLSMLFLGLTGLIHFIGKYTPKSTVRGVQAAVGTVLMAKGLKFMISPDPNLVFQSLGPVNMGILLGIAGMIITFLLLENRRLPAAVVIVFGGILLGLLITKLPSAGELKAGLHIPLPFPYGVPSWSDMIWVIPVVVLPQIPMTIGNAVISNTDLTHEYFGKRAKRISYASVAVSQGIAGIISFIMGGIPMCHGAGGLAAHYRFGARTAGSNLMIGGLFLFLGLLFGQGALAILKLLPLSMLGVLLVFAGAQLTLMILDIKERKDLFVVFSMLAISLVTNLAVAFISGIIIAGILKSGKIKV